MILAGDIGGTKTVLALYSKEQGVASGAVHEARFESDKYSSLEAMITEFLRETKARPDVASFGVAGPVKHQRAQITNLPWVISAEDLRNAFDIPKVLICNDLESVAVAVPHLGPDDFCTINEGVAEPQGTMAIIAPGTGLGIAFLMWTGETFNAFASEGGHSAFSPRSLQEMALLKYLTRRYGHVSFERICSGSQLPNIYDFFVEKGGYREPDWLRDELSRVTDRTPVIVRAALEHKAGICEATLDMFVRILGTVTGNMAVTLLATGGIYLGGGIPPRIVKRLQRPDFLSAIADKGRFSTLCSRMPVHVILDAKAALHGAAQKGFDALAGA